MQYVYLLRALKYHGEMYLQAFPLLNSLSILSLLCYALCEPKIYKMEQT